MNEKTTARLENIGRVLDEIKKAMPSTYGGLDTAFLYDLCQDLIKDRDKYSRAYTFMINQMFKVSGHISRHEDKWFDEILTEMHEHEKRLTP